MVPSGLCNCTTYIYIYIQKYHPYQRAKLWSTFQIPSSLASLHGLTSLLLASHVLEFGKHRPQNWWELVFQIQGDFVETRYFMVTTLLYQLFPFFEANSQGFSGKKLQLLPVLSRLTSCIAGDCEAHARFFGI